MKKILFVASMIVFGFTSAQAQYGPQRDHDRDRYESRDYDRPGYANSKDSEINYLKREARQRIDTGIRRRVLSPREADALMMQYHRIEAKERKFSNRGRLSTREARILRNDLENLLVDTRKLSGRRGNDNWARGRGRY